MDMLRAILLGLLLGLPASTLTACSDDDSSSDDDGGDGDTGDGDTGDGDTGDGDTGDGDTGDGDTGDGDTGDGDTGDGDASLTKAQCLEMALDTVVSEECLDCTCEADPQATVDCGEACWMFLACITDSCGGDFTDGDCLNANCSEIVAEDESAATVAMVLGPPYGACGSVCGVDEGDGGMDDDAGQ